MRNGTAETGAEASGQDWTMLSGVAVSVPTVLPGMLHLFDPDTTKDLVENLLRKRSTGSVGLTCADVMDYLEPMMDVSYDEVSDLLYEMRRAGTIWTVRGWKGDIEYTVWDRER